MTLELSRILELLHPVMFPLTSFVLVALILSGGHAMVLPNASDIILASSWRPDIFSIPRVQYVTGDEGPSREDPDAMRLADNTSKIGPLLMAYYPDWAGDEFPPEKIDFSRFDWIDFAFAIPDESFALTWDDPVEAPDLLSRLVSSAHTQGKKVKLSVGGWTGSKHFSSAVATQESRECFAQNIMQLYQDFHLDGIDIDWEYPGHAGETANQVSADDSNNFLLFLHQLRSSLPPSAKISAAATQQPFVDATGQAMHNVADFANVLDWILIMNYDTWGSSRKPGPNAPMFDACKNSTQPYASAVGAYESWIASDFPPSKLVLGVPTYGYVSQSSADSLRTRRRERNSLENVTNIVAVGDSEGQISFRELIQQGVLAPDINRHFVGSGGFEREWDECSCTPFLRSTSAGQVVSYDDPRSLGMKAEFAKRTGMLGINLFDISGDSDGWDLTAAVAQGLSSGHLL